MPKIDDSEIDEDTLPTRGRRAAPKSRFATVSAALLDPIAPLVARIAAWVSAHRLGALLTVAVVVAVTAIGSGAALMRTVSETAFSERRRDVDPREPTDSRIDRCRGQRPAGPDPADLDPGTAVPHPRADRRPRPMRRHRRVPDPEPTAEPEPSDTPEPTTDHPGNGNGKGKGTPGGPNKPD